MQGLSQIVFSLFTIDAADFLCYFTNFSLKILLIISKNMVSLKCMTMRPGNAWG